LCEINLIQGLNGCQPKAGWPHPLTLFASPSLSLSPSQSFFLRLPPSLLTSFPVPRSAFHVQYAFFPSVKLLEVIDLLKGILLPPRPREGRFREAMGHFSVLQAMENPNQKRSSRSCRSCPNHSLRLGVFACGSVAELPPSAQGPMKPFLESLHWARDPIFHSDPLRFA
jgi:hypothetical protein